MRSVRRLLRLSLVILTATGSAQLRTVYPQVRAKPSADTRITTIELRAHFVTTIRVPEAVNSVVVGDPALFEVEHSEHEPELVFVKALTTADAESNLLISTAKGRQISFLLVSHGRAAGPAKVDFLVRYQTAAGFLIAPDAIPFALVAETTSVPQPQSEAGPTATTTQASRTLTPAGFNLMHTQEASNQPTSDALDSLLERQMEAPLPLLYDERMEGDEVKSDRLRAGIGEVLDGGQQVIVLFSVVNTSKHAILLMPPQVQLGGQERSGKVIKHEHWSTAEQLPVADFRLSRRRIGPRERADGVVVFERPPYKRSMETLFLQMAESGAVDKPALVPIGFGVSTVREAANYAH